MNKVILTAAALLALTSAASAAEMPKAFHGDWCEAVVDGVTYRRLTKADPCESHDSRMMVTSRGNAFYRGECKVLKARRRGQAYDIKFRCEGNPDEAMGSMNSRPGRSRTRAL
jgi:hypothetical protein